MSLRPMYEDEIEYMLLKEAYKSECIQRKVFVKIPWLIPDSKELISLATELTHDAVRQYSIHVDRGCTAAAEFAALVFSLLEQRARRTRFPQWDHFRKMLAVECATGSGTGMSSFRSSKLVFTGETGEWKEKIIEWSMNRAEIYITVSDAKGKRGGALALLTTYGLLCSYSIKTKQLALVDAKNNQDIINLCLSLGLSGDALITPDVAKFSKVLVAVKKTHIPMIISLLAESAKRVKPWSPFRRWFSLQVLSLVNLLRALR